MKLTVYSKPQCPWCAKAKDFLAERRVPYDEVVIPELPDRQALYDKLQLVGKDRTVPQIILTGEDGEDMRIGGWDALLISGIESLRIAGLQDAMAKHPDGAEEVMIRRTAASTTPGFMLLPVDEFALATVDFWIERALTKLPPDSAKIASARRRRAEIVAWQEIYGVKTPD